MDKEEASKVLQEYHSMLTTTSPNALFLASLDAMQAHFHDSGPQWVRETAERVTALKKQLNSYGIFLDQLRNDIG